ncbi:MAG TPA: chorismate pyruvate-lyase family protein [Acidimicrobiia bacterium]|jgi:chorismate-pyruvate lyase|nr:chorismate pyruvate-lyase family protein [Acidimicrobiia bacterium]
MEHQSSAVGTAAGFDPAAEVFVAQFARPETLQPVNFRALSPFYRSLLVIDGTVTKFIEAFTMEPVVVERLSQEEFVLPADHEWLEAPAGTRVIAREVLLRGTLRGVVFAHAASLLVTERLPSSVQDELATHPGGLGRIMNDAGLETRRDILWYGRERNAVPPEGLGGRGEFIARTYRVVHDGRPFMLINEKFPVGVDPAPSLD